MLNMPLRKQLELEEPLQYALVAAARDEKPVSGLTHNFYRYPARFSPAFVRTAIETFTVPGETILDPYVGGGTSLVEAMALGRHGMGVDISELADFISTVKTTILDDNELNELRKWADRVGKAIHLGKPSIYFSRYAENGYYRHLDAPSRWRFRHAIEQALGTAIALHSPRLEAFARCVILRTAQWALDSRRTLPSLSEFRTRMRDYADQMIRGLVELRTAYSSHWISSEIRILNESAANLDIATALGKLPAPALVITSPPYPGIHVLYHRWQVDGRKETPAPFWIANKMDGSGLSYYTMGDRNNPGLHSYFSNLQASTTAFARILADDTLIVQIVAFSTPEWQLPRYLEVMNQAGLEEQFLSVLNTEKDGRLWRSVPNRRWYAGQRGTTPGSQEVVLFHRKIGGENTLTRCCVDLTLMQLSATSSEA